MAERKSIIWGDIAVIQVKRIIQYYYENIGNTQFSEKLITEIDHILNLIIVNNYLGKSIPKTNFRSVIVYSYAIIYEVKENHIYFALFWDSHRDPEILKILMKELF